MSLNRNPFTKDEFLFYWNTDSHFQEYSFENDVVGNLPLFILLVNNDLGKN